MLRIFLALWLAITPVFALAGSMTLLKAGSAGAASTPFSLTWISPIGSNTTAGTSFTFAAQNIGVADATRIIAVGIVHGGTTGITVTGVTIGGQAATQATNAVATSAAGIHSDIWYYADAGALGTSASIVVTVSATQSRCAISVYRVVGTGAAFSAANNGADNSGTTVTIGNISVPSGGGLMAIVGTHSAAQAGTITATGVSVDSNGVAFGSSTIGSGSETGTSGTVSTVFSYTGTVDSVASGAAFTP